MDTKRYMISDAARLVDVEAHVLRYWEDELELPICQLPAMRWVTATIQKITSKCFTALRI